MQVIQRRSHQLGSYRRASVFWLPCHRSSRQTRPASSRHLCSSDPVRCWVLHQREACSLGRSSRRLGQFLIGILSFKQHFLHCSLNTTITASRIDPISVNFCSCLRTSVKYWLVMIFLTSLCFVKWKFTGIMHEVERSTCCDDMCYCIENNNRPTDECDFDTW